MDTHQILTLRKDLRCEVPLLLGEFDVIYYHKGARIYTVQDTNILVCTDSTLIIMEITNYRLNQISIILLLLSLYILIIF